jgi:peptide chain release factor 3
MMWPAGAGLNFKGALDLRADEFIVFASGSGQGKRIGGNAMRAHLAPDVFAKLEEEAELAQAGLPHFRQDRYHEGHLTPVYFGSALRNFGVKELIAALAEFAPSPRAQAAQGRTVEPSETEVTGFVFKVQANMDPNCQ